MERIEYDPEIDPSIREAKEAAERERELSARIRLEIERYVADNDLVPRDQAQQESAQLPPPWDKESDETTSPKTARIRAREAKEAARQAKEQAKRAAKEARRTQRAANAASRRKAVTSVFTGSILSNERVRKLWPYLLGIAVVLVLYIAYTFHVQSMHLERQILEREVRELGYKAVERTAERVSATRRSAIVERLKEKNIPLEEFSYPVKRIER